MTEESFNNYTLAQIKDHIADALSSDISPSDIVNAIQSEIKELIDYHQVQAAKAQKLLNLLQGDRELSPEVEDMVEDLNIEHLMKEVYDNDSPKGSPFDLNSFGLNPPNVYRWKHNKDDDKRNKKRNK